MLQITRTKQRCTAQFRAGNEKFAGVRASARGVDPAETASEEGDGEREREREREGEREL